MLIISVSINYIRNENGGNGNNLLIHFKIATVNCLHVNINSAVFFLKNNFIFQSKE